MTFETIYAALASIFIAGIFTDGWAHNHIPKLETFFTPWHAILYGGYLMTSAFLVFALLRQRRSGLPWARCLPYGYWTALVGAGVFFLSGLGDMAWHLAFGIEQGTEALFSPTHLGLAVGATLMFSAPLRAAWKRPGAAAPWLAIVSMTLCVSIFSFMTQFVHPIRVRAAGPGPVTEALRNDGTGLGASALIIQTAILAGASILLVKRWKTPPGAFALVYGANMLGMSFMNDQSSLILGAALAGAVIDLHLWRRPGPVAGTRPLRVIGRMVPAVYGLFYLVTLMLTGGIWWSIHVWTGVIVMSSLGGWLIAVVASPPAAPAEV